MTLLVIGQCPSKCWPHARNRRRYTLVNHGHPGHGAQRKESASTMLESSAVLLEWSRTYTRCAWVVMTGPNMIYTFHEESGRRRPIQLRFRPRRCEFLHLCKWPNHGNHCLLDSDASRTDESTFGLLPCGCDLALGRSSGAILGA